MCERGGREGGRGRERERGREGQRQGGRTGGGRWEGDRIIKQLWQKLKIDQSG